MDDQRPLRRVGQRLASEELAKELGVTRVTLLSLAHRYKVGELHEDGNYSFDTVDALRIRALLSSFVDLSVAVLEEQHES